MTTDTAYNPTTTVYSGRAEELRAMGLQITQPSNPNKVYWADADGHLILTQQLDRAGTTVTEERWNDPDDEYLHDRAFMDRYGLPEYERKAEADAQQEADAEAGDAPAFGTQVPGSAYHPRDIVGVETAPGGNGILRVLREHKDGSGRSYYDGHAHVVLTPAECRKLGALLTEAADEADAR